jgi:hypothetical protein
MGGYTLGDTLDAKHGRIEAAAHRMSGPRALSVAHNVFRLYKGVVDIAIYGLDED